MTVKKITQNMYRDFFYPHFERMKELSFFKEIAIGSLFILAAVGGFYMYRVWNSGKEQEAQKIFEECFQEYQRALQGSDELWSEVAMMCKLGYERYGATNIGPFFLGLQADALLWQGKKPEALTFLDKMIYSLSGNPLISIYKIKRALIKCDSDDDNMQQQGRTELEELAHDQRNIQADEAYYYLGYSYWTRNELEQAKRVWQELLEKFKKDNPQSVSVWMLLAEQKIKQIP